MMRQLDITSKEEARTCQVREKMPQTLFEHIESVVKQVENSGLSDDFFIKVEKSVQYISQKMNLTSIQAVLFSVFIEHSDDNRIYISELSKFMGCKKVRMIGLMNDIDALENRRLLRCSKTDNMITYRVPLQVIEAVKKNINYVPENTRDLHINVFFKHMNRLFEERENNEIASDALRVELLSLVEDNPSLPFCIQLQKYTEMCNIPTVFPLFLYFCHRFINHNDDSVGLHELEDLYEDRFVYRDVRCSLEEEYNDLIIHDIIEHSFDNGFKEKEFFRISSQAKEKLFEGLDVKIHPVETKKGWIEHENIVTKQLFYNDREQLQIKQLTSLLQKENFQSVQESLIRNGMRKGFACLFYGSPGTGKTETVYQLARSTGRDIMMVDISETKSMWYGESEKRIKQIFDTYRYHVDAKEVAPILLFNEADAIIGSRREVGNSHINQLENTIQNILLQEIENLEGILIATTNLTRNLDKAFDRRFLYKIEFDKPNLEAKENIWNMMLPSLSKKERQVLAVTYDFSGGQIENIARKCTVDSILNGTQTSLERIRDYCENESLHRSYKSKRIGFC